MYKDEIVEDVRRIRDELAAKYKYDVKAILDAARRQQRRSKHKIVPLPKKKQKISA